MKRKFVWCSVLFYYERGKNLTIGQSRKRRGRSTNGCDAINTNHAAEEEGVYCLYTFFRLPFVQPNCWFPFQFHSAVVHFLIRVLYCTLYSLRKGNCIFSVLAIKIFSIFFSTLSNISQHIEICIITLVWSDYRRGTDR